jgi:hypothetical protein
MDPFVWFVIGAFGSFAVVLGVAALITRDT